jgi:hypothetical protein
MRSPTLTGSKRFGTGDGDDEDDSGCAAPGFVPPHATKTTRRAAARID